MILSSSLIKVVDNREILNHIEHIKSSSKFNKGKGPPFQFLTNFNKSQRAPLTFFGTMRLFQNIHFSKIFYVSLQVFYCFATKWIFKKPKGSPSYNFKNFSFLSLRYSADFSVPVLLVMTKLTSN